MEVLRIVFKIIYLIISLVLVVLVLKQNKEDNGASGAIMASSTNNFYDKNKGRTKEGKLKRATIIFMVLFFVVTVCLDIIIF